MLKQQQCDRFSVIASSRPATPWLSGIDDDVLVEEEGPCATADAKALGVEL